MNKVLSGSGVTRVSKKGMDPFWSSLFCSELDMGVNGVDVL